MNTLTATKSDENKVKPWNLLGALGFEGFGDFETEKPVTSALDFVGEVIVDAVSLAKQEVAGIEPEISSQEAQKFPPQGTIEFNKAQAKAQEDIEQRKEADSKRVFFQALKDDTQRAEQAKNRMLFEEEMNDIITNLPTDQKNELLHYQASYKDRSIYQRAELRKKLVEQRKEADKKQKETSIAQTQPKASAMNAAFEGGSGTQGGGQGNLSFQATG